MRESKIIQEEIQHLENVIQKGKKILEGGVSDFALELSLGEDEKRYFILLDELTEAYEYEQKHSLRYVLDNVEKYSSVPVKKIAESLNVFQGLIEKIGKTIYKENPIKVSLGLVTTYPGSFGMLLTTEIKDRELLSKTYSIFEFFFDVVNKLNNNDDTYSIITELVKNKSLLRSFIKFYKIQSEENVDLKLTWGDTYHNKHGIFIKNERSSYIYNSLKKYSEIPDKDLEIDGIIKGISLIKKKIEFVTNEYGVIDIHASDDQIFLVEKHFDQEIKLLVRLSQIENEVLDQTKKNWQLLNIIN